MRFNKKRAHSTATRPRSAYGGDFGRRCPVCREGTLSCPNAKRNADGSVLVRRRVCEDCGTVVSDTITRTREILGQEMPNVKGQAGSAAACVQTPAFIQ